MRLFGQQHVERYEATNGAEGHDWEGTRALLLTTTGRRTGERRTVPLIYGRRGNAYTVIASRAGSDHHPGWYLNLRDEPEVEIQVKGDRMKGRARTAMSAEKPAMWAAMAADWPKYDEYPKMTEREIPLVVIEPI